MRKLTIIAYSVNFSRLELFYRFQIFHADSNNNYKYDLESVATL